jgi:hypothetical protein
MLFRFHMYHSGTSATVPYLFSHLDGDGQRRSYFRAPAAVTAWCRVSTAEQHAGGARHNGQLSPKNKLLCSSGRDELAEMAVAAVRAAGRRQGRRSVVTPLRENLFHEERKREICTFGT